MSPWTLLKYLLGSREAIVDLAGSRASVGVGVLLVLSAGLAREYDGEDLVHEPWHALRPLAASLASGTLLFLVVHVAALMRSHAADRSRAGDGDGDGEQRGEQPGFIEAWWRFMGLFWLTAPMAWLYAVPYERMVSPVDAIRLNLWTLGLVALWRVVLMVRVVHVLYGIRHVYAFFLVMAFADAVVFTVVTTVPTPVLDVMGGIRQSQRDALLASVTFTVTVLSVLTAPVWIIGALVSAARLRPRWPRLAGRPARPGSRGLLIFAAGSVLAFVPLLMLGQPEQINRRQVERLFAQGRVPEALAAMSQHTLDDYPPHWDPPPRLGYRESRPSLAEIQDAMAADWPADWVAQVYLDKIDQKLKSEIAPFSGYNSWEQIAELLQEYPDVYTVDAAHRRSARFLGEHLESLTDADREALRQIAQPAAAAEPAAP